MGENRDWWAEEDTSASPEWHRTQQLFPPPASPASAESPRRSRRSTLPLVAVVVCLIATIGFWKGTADAEHEEAPAKKAATQETKAPAREEAVPPRTVEITDLAIDGIQAEAEAEWAEDGRSVTLSAKVVPEGGPKFARITSGVQTDEGDTQPFGDAGPSKPVYLDLEVPLKPRQKVQMKISVGEPHKDPTSHRTLEFRSDRTALDAATGMPLKQRYSSDVL